MNWNHSRAIEENGEDIFMVDRWAEGNGIWSEVEPQEEKAHERTSTDWVGDGDCTDTLMTLPGIVVDMFYHTKHLLERRFQKVYDTRVISHLKLENEKYSWMDVLVTWAVIFHPRTGWDQLDKSEIVYEKCCQARNRAKKIYESFAKTLEPELLREVWQGRTLFLGVKVDEELSIKAV